jgi:hypothetical protein
MAQCNSGNVQCCDFETTIAGNSSGNWNWPNAWEWISVTAVVLGTNEDVSCTVTSVSSDDAGNRQINFTLVNKTPNGTQLFLTLSRPGFSVL